MCEVFVVLRWYGASAEHTHCALSSSSVQVPACTPSALGRVESTFSFFNVFNVARPGTAGLEVCYLERVLFCI